MFNMNRVEEEGLNRAIDRILAQMDAVTGDSPQYSLLADQLAKLYEIKRNNAPDRVSKDTLAMVMGNLAGIALIVNYERLNVVTSKAIGFVLKSK